MSCWLVDWLVDEFHVFLILEHAICFVKIKHQFPASEKPETQIIQPKPYIELRRIPYILSFGRPEKLYCDIPPAKNKQAHEAFMGVANGSCWLTRPIRFSMSLAWSLGKSWGASTGGSFHEDRIWLFFCPA
jgi:hypothetical protein